VWKCPAVVYGPGDSALDHTPNEHINLEDYRKAVDVLSAALLKITGHV
jgi:LysW-gamma-L-lysine carboxypeptidase